MKKFTALIMAFVMALAVNVMPAAAESENIPAFPGAEGGGKYATGGRGGKVYYVTNLNDSGEGSFRDAVSGSNRIVVFKVGGTIELKSDVSVKSNVTIAGQTAPGGQGITLKNYKLGLGGSNIICRFISSRPGERGTSADYDALGGSDGSNSIVDHCSFGWANDEMWGLYSNNDRNTVQWSLIGPSNSFSYHSKGIHGFAAMFGKSNVTWHHNMLAHNVSRNFRGKVEGTNTAEFVNNVIYNWGYQTAYGTLGHLNYVSNYLKAGNGTDGGYHYISVPDSGSNPEKYKLYLTGNKIVDKDGNDILNSSGENMSEDNWAGISLTEPDTYNQSTLESDSPFKITEGTENIAYAQYAESADDAYENVLKYSGCGISPDKRADIDKQVMYEAQTGTGNLTGARPYDEANSTQKATLDKYNIQCGTEYVYPDAVTDGAYTDTDGDGMSDEWETERGLDPNTDDSSGDYCGQGYTNIEYFINDLTVDAFPEGTVSVSPTLMHSIEVGADNAYEEGVSYSSLEEAVEYINANPSENDAEKIKLTLNEGIEGGDIVITSPNVNIIGNGNSISSVTLSETADSFSAGGVDIKTVTSLADKAVFENCGIEYADTSERAYFKQCSFVSDDTAAHLGGNTVLNGCSISAKTAVSADAVVLLLNSDIKADKIASLTDDAVLAAYESNLNNSPYGDGGSFAQCGCSGSDGTYELIESVFLTSYSPYTVLKGDDGWNPDEFDEQSPQDKLEEYADTIKVSSGIITKETELPTGEDGRSISWSCDTEGILDGNTIVIDEENEGVKEAVLTAVISQEGLEDVLKTFKILVSSVDTNDFVISFDDEEVGAIPSYFDVSTEKYKKGSSDAFDCIDWGVTDNINGEAFADQGNFYQINQTGSTETDETADSSKGIHDFVYSFGDMGDCAIEAGFDVYAESMTAESFFEAYVKSSKSNSSKSIAQLRFSNTGGVYNASAYSGSTASSLIDSSANGKWHRVKIIIDTRNIETTIPTISYYIYDMDGNIEGKLEGALSKTDYSQAEYQQNIPAQLVFRPNRKLAQCEFYVDNLYVKNISEGLTSEAQSVELDVRYSSGKLPSYGSQATPITWTVTEGNPNLVNSDGTINYDLCKEQTVSVIGTLSASGFSVKTQEFTITIVGTADEDSEYVDARYFTDTEDFSSWGKQSGYESSIFTDDTTDVGGNSSVKIRLDDKAVYRQFENPLSSGKFKFSTDFLTTGDDRTFRIYFENRADSSLPTTNVVYHIMDADGTARTVSEDEPTAKTGGNTVCQLEANKWYNIEIMCDIDENSVETKIFDESGTLLGSTTESFIKEPTDIYQIRLVRTAAGPVYFDNISLQKANDEEDDDSDILYGDANDDGIITANDALVVLQYSLNSDGAVINLDAADVNKDAKITANDALAILQKSLNNDYVF